MLSVAVTGSAGALGKRVVARLVQDPDVYRVVAIDRRHQRSTADKVTALGLELSGPAGDPDELAAAFTGCDSIVHSASDEGRVSHHLVAADILARVLDAATDAGVGHVVIISSAMVYGAWPDNPIPLAEDAPLRANDDLAFVAAKLEMERLASTWASSGRRAAVLRPTTTLAESGSSWMARSLRIATTIRSDRVDPPVQFVHYDDVASAAAIAATQRAPGVYNVSPDGFIGSEAFHQLVGGLQLRVPGDLSDLVLRAGRQFGIRPTPEGIEPYVHAPWVVANDKLRSLGWTPQFSNEEAFVLGTPPPPWEIPPSRRQEFVLAGSALLAAGALAGAVVIARRLTRR
jgi:nucleoside-diphosphate-sugar epimerase